MKHPSSRVAILRLLAVLLAFVLVAAACGGGDGDDNSGADTGDDGGSDDTGGGDDSGGGDDGGGDDGDDTEANTDTAPEEDVISSDDPIPGGTLRISITSEIDGLNPTKNRFSASGHQMAHAVFEPLFTWSIDGVAVPYLAESGVPSDDGMSYVVNLRPGVTFHDGTPLDADALIANIEAQLADFLVSLAIKSSVDAENPVEKVGDLAVQFNLSRPNVQWNGFLTAQLGYVASPTWLAVALEDTTLNQSPVGTGPFVFDTRAEDSFTRFVRNDNWWQGAAFVDAVEFYPITDGLIAAGQLIAGDLDGVSTTNDDVTLLLRDEGDDFVRIENDTGSESFGIFNTSVPPFDDIRVRQAATFAFPQNDYLEFIGQGVTRRADSMFPPESPWKNPDVVQQTDMPELAGPLIDAYCADVPDQCSDGKVNIEFQYSGPSVVQDRVFDVAAAAWGDFFNVEADVLFEDDHINEVLFGAYQFATWRQFENPDPAAERVWLACDSVVPGLSLNFPRLCNEDRDVLLNAQLATTDQAERIEHWQGIQQEMLDDFAYIFFQHTVWLYALGSNIRNQCGAVTADGVQMSCTESGAQWFHTIWFAE